MHMKNFAQALIDLELGTPDFVFGASVWLLFLVHRVLR
jgi:hypothetical protein